MSSLPPKRTKNIHKSSSVQFNRYTVDIGRGSPVPPEVSGRSASLSSIPSPPTSIKSPPMSQRKITELPKPVKEIVAKLDFEAGEPQDQVILPRPGRNFNQTSDTAASDERISSYLSYAEQSNESEAMVNHYGQIERADDSPSAQTAIRKALDKEAKPLPEIAETALAEARQVLTSHGEGIIAAIENEISKVESDIQPPLKAIEANIQDFENTLKGVEKKLEKAGQNLPPPKIVIVRATDPPSEELYDVLPTPNEMTLPQEPILSDIPAVPIIPDLPVETPVVMAGGLPAGVNGISLPGPKRVRKRQLMIRKARRLILRRPILQALLGRELASTTEPALKLAATKVTMEVTVEAPVEAPVEILEVAGGELPSFISSETPTVGRAC